MGSGARARGHRRVAKAHSKRRTSALRPRSPRRNLTAMRRCAISLLRSGFTLTLPAALATGCPGDDTTPSTGTDGSTGTSDTDPSAGRATASVCTAAARS
jgi:hypothetical protein